MKDAKKKLEDQLKEPRKIDKLTVRPPKLEARSQSVGAECSRGKSR